ncbi:AI-2E family transporter [Paenibacillus gorillae]|uniref:AI-2E family transporter n=1 Tax=Paenibacillus gorillae TaxID=1243662 RepID=UPI0004BB2E3B|nr:AI-2E family transporter [Paenibacillus gorillae]
MGFLREFFSNHIVKRILFLAIVALLLFVLRDMINLILLVFLVTFVLGRLEGFITKKLSRFIPISPIVVNIVIYVLLISGIVIGFLNYVPKLVVQVAGLYNYSINFLNSPPQNDTAQLIVDMLEKLDFQSYWGNTVNYILKLGKSVEMILFVIVLSFFYLMQKNKVVKFTEKFGSSKIGWLYNEFNYFGKKFTSSFGKVIEVQLMIALFNTILTIAGLWILGYPYLFALTIMVFLLSLIPVAGVVISFIPIGMIGYQIGGLSLVIWSIVLVVVIHGIETYVLNPRLYAQKTKLPMFYTFIILIFAQHFMGIWGLIIGIPIFMFLLDVLNVNQSGES